MTNQIIERLKNDDVRFTLTQLTQPKLVNMGWDFNDDENTGNYEIDYFDGQFRLLGNTENNDCYVVEGTTEGCGGIQGIIELVETGGDFNDVVSWVSEYGVCNLIYHSQKPLI